MVSGGDRRVVGAAPARHRPGSRLDVDRPVVPADQEVQDRADEVDEDDDHRPDALVAAADPAVVAEQVDDGEDEQRQLDDRQRDDEQEDARVDVAQPDMHLVSMADPRIASRAVPLPVAGRGAGAGRAALDSGEPRVARADAPRRRSTMTDDRERWALILGASSGMGEATSLALAGAGYRIFGIHLDFRAALAHVDEVRARIEAAGSEALFINMNAADDEKRAAALATLRDRFERSRAAGHDPYVRVVMHSLAFGSLVPFLADDPKAAVDRKKMEMTQDVMANSLVYWVQDLYHGEFLDRGSKIYAMTAEGTSRVVPSYGVVSGAKAALESHVRQLAMEFARLHTGGAVNSIRAGVTDTPALRKIPENQRMIDITLARNPHSRMTTPQDVADAIVTLSATDSDWISGNIISVDGGEFVTG